MSVITVVQDTFKGLVNTLTGLGGSADKGAAINSVFGHTVIDPQQLEASYRSMWMIRKAVDIPAFDMLREGWSWNAEKDVIEKIEAAERKFDLASNLHDALRWSRLYGGAAIILNDGSQDPMQPLGKIGKGGLKFIKAVNRTELVSQELELDPRSQFYGQPTMYQMNGSLAGTVYIHPSRVVRFVGADIPRLSHTITDEWGDSIVEVLEQAVKDATATQQGIAHLVQEAKVDVLRIKNLMVNVMKKEYREAFEARVALNQTTKGMLGTTILDMDDEYQQKTISFTQLPEVLQLLLQIVSGAADIPITRFLGQSPGGMNSTGESDMMNYYNRIKSNQNLDLRPPLQRLLDVILASELGEIPSDVTWDFRPLHQMTAKEQSEIQKNQADSFKTVTETNLIPREVMAEAQANAMIESGAWPGFEAAWEKFKGGKLAPADLGEDDDNADDDIAATPAARRAQLKVVGDAMFADGEPKPLYVSREVKNKAEITKWAKGQGFKTVQRDLHVTLIYSKSPVDFMKMGSSWDEEMTIPKGGPREMEVFGQEQDCVVLRFNSNALKWRVQEMMDAGATSDFDEYRPHITITLNRGDVDVSKVVPYNGRIILGPEIFAPINLDVDWKSKVVEE